MRRVLAIALLACATSRAGAEPAPPTALQGVAEVGVGLGFSCARTEAGRVLCWGHSKLGHLGLVEETRVPVEIPLPARERRLWVRGDFPVCAELERDGSLWCWGNGEHVPVIQRGLEQSPGIVDLLRSVVLRCALLRDGTVRCAGHHSLGNGFGPLTGAEVVGRAYEPIADLADAVQLGLESEFACARTRGGAVRCWGRNNLGQLGTGRDTGPTASPVTPRGLDRDVRDLAVLGDAACAIVGGGAVRCWGEAGMDHPVRFGRTPTALRLPGPARSLHAWVNGVLALLEGGTLATWGYTALGDGRSRSVRRPTSIVGVTGATRVTGVSALFASTAEGWLCWGDCAGAWESSPVGPVGLASEAAPPVTDVASSVTCAVLAGEVLCRGPNDRGQLGDGTTIDRRAEWRPVHAPPARPR